MTKTVDFLMQRLKYKSESFILSPDHKEMLFGLTDINFHVDL